MAELSGISAVRIRPTSVIRAVQLLGLQIAVMAGRESWRMMSGQETDFESEHAISISLIVIFSVLACGVWKGHNLSRIVLVIASLLLLVPGILIILVMPYSSSMNWPVICTVMDAAVIWMLCTNPGRIWFR